VNFYHCTTDKKLKRYKNSGRILSPVRFFSTIYSAEKWCKKTGRNIILKITTDKYYPLPIKGGAYWIDTDIISYERLK